MPFESFSFDPTVIIAITLAFFLGGYVKGAASFGLPLVTVPLVSFVMPVPMAIAVAMMPIVTSNIFQAWQNWSARAVLRRVWPLYVAFAITMTLTLQVMSLARPVYLAVAMAVILEIYVITQLLGFAFQVPGRRELGYLLGSGVVSGLTGGVTSFYGFPSVAVFLGMNLGRTGFSLAICTLFLVGSAVLYPGLAVIGALGTQELALSAFGIIPVLIGQILGRRFRDRISEKLFQFIVLGVLACVGIAMLVRAFASL